MKRGIVVVLVLVVLAALVGGIWWYKAQENSDVASFRTATVTRGDLLQTITASGTLQAQQVIDVGSQVTGPIANFGTDKNGKSVDYRSEVEKGKLLATIDQSVYKSEVDQAQAAVNQATAALDSAQADLGQLQAKANQSQRDWDRAQKLGPSDALAQSSYDSYEAAYEIAKANVGVGQASIESAKAGIAAAQASLEKAQRNLGYCVITAPVDGVIIDRRVNIGQTVVSSQSVSSLFLIAADLKKMQIWASVNEADVGNIHSGQAVTFTVDAFPNRTFKGTVDKLRYNATMTNNVVTYTAEIEVDNSDETLIPYMTTNVAFEVAKRDDVILVPNAALRYAPDASKLDPAATTDATTAPSGSAEPATEPAAGGGRRGGGGGRHKGGGMNRWGTVYVANGNFAKPIKVERGITDGVNTEIKSGDLTENTQIIIGDAIASDRISADTVNPFAPKMPSGRGSSGKSR